MYARDIWFEEYVKEELGDIAVWDNGKYISPKIQTYFKIWNARKNPEGFISVPLVPTEHQWGNLARDIMMWLDFERKTPRNLFEHLRRLGVEVPSWLKNESEMQSLDSVPSKGTRCAIIYRAMLEAYED